VTRTTLDVGQGVLVGGKVAVTKVASGVDWIAIDWVDEQAANKVAAKSKIINRFILSPKQALG